MDTRKIGIFDSGVGGLTVLSELRKILPNEDMVYIGDTKRFPYGNKTKESIISISKKITEKLIDKNVKIIVIACGTATSQAMAALKKMFAIPIVGIIEPTIENIIKEDTKRIGIIATRGTIRSKVWNEKLLKKKKDLTVISSEAPLLASMAEEGWIDNEAAKFAIKEYTKPFVGKVDKLILGCTHYPLFKTLIQKELGEDVTLINTGEEIASYLSNYLKENKMENGNEKTGKEEIYLTDTECNFVKVATMLLGEEIKDKIKKIEI